MKVHGSVRNLVKEDFLAMYISARVLVIHRAIVITVPWRKIDVALVERNVTKFHVNNSKYRRVVTLVVNC
jgi:hypothetical protein